MNISRAHVPDWDYEILERYAKDLAEQKVVPPLIVHTYEKGLFFYVFGVPELNDHTQSLGPEFAQAIRDKLKYNGLSQDFMRIYDHCKSYDIDLVVIDQDGEIHQLPIFGDDAMLTAVEMNDRVLCNECFNTLPEKDRGGKGARAAGWVSPDAPKLHCDSCNRECVDTEGE